jgi:U3 small nucleolar RNA-associated protein 20
MSRSPAWHARPSTSCRRSSAQRRDERRRKRRIEAVSEPEKWAKEKKKKFDAKKARIKEKGAEERGKRRGW